MMPRPPRIPLFPYTTLFRSQFMSSADPKRFPNKLWRIQRAKLQTLSAALALGLELMVETSNMRCTDCKRVQARSEEHTSELQSHVNLVCRLLLEKKKQQVKK